MAFEKAMDVQEHAAEAENFVYFTFVGISTFLNKKNEEKKEPKGMPKWQEINKANFRNYIKANHKGFAILCGELSGITVFDFDDASEYHRMLLAFPDLAQYYTVETKHGYHVYCKYDPSVSSTTNGLISFSKVDIRSDQSVLFSPPTTYTLMSGEVFTYKYLGGEILEIPEIILSNLKQFQHSRVRGEGMLKFLQVVGSGDTDVHKDNYEKNIEASDPLELVSKTPLIDRFESQSKPQIYSQQHNTRKGIAPVNSLLQFLSKSQSQNLQTDLSTRDLNPIVGSNPRNKLKRLASESVASEKLSDSVASEKFSSNDSHFQTENVCSDDKPYAIVTSQSENTTVTEGSRGADFTVVGVSKSSGSSNGENALVGTDNGDWGSRMSNTMHMINVKNDFPCPICRRRITGTIVAFNVHLDKCLVGCTQGIFRGQSTSGVRTSAANTATLQSRLPFSIKQRSSTVGVKNPY